MDDQGQADGGASLLEAGSSTASMLNQPLLAGAPPSTSPRPTGSASCSNTPISQRRAGGGVTRSRSQDTLLFVHSQSAAAEDFEFPIDPFCAHCGKKRHTGAREAHWGTRLCETCYDVVAKECTECGARLLAKQLLWNSGLCDNCYDHKKHSSHDPKTDGAIAADVRAILAQHIDLHEANRSSLGLHSASLCLSCARQVGTLIGAQLIFYMAPAVMTPSLFLEIQSADWLSDGDAAAAYAAVLTTTTVVAMAAPVPFGLWAEARGEHEVYVGVTLAATIAALVLAFAPTIGGALSGLGLPTFAGAWGCLSAPLSLRGVRAAYFSRHVRASESKPR